MEKDLEIDPQKFFCLRISRPAPWDIEGLDRIKSEVQSRLITLIDGKENYETVSQRYQEGFLINGKGTAKRTSLSKRDYTRVFDWSFRPKIDYICCMGKIDAPLEALVHSAIYDLDPIINSIIYLQGKNLDTENITKLNMDKTDYGTSKMVQEFSRIYQETNLKEEKVFSLTGEKEGIISFGKNPREAEQILLSYFLHKNLKERKNRK